MRKVIEKFGIHSVLIFASLLSIFPFIWLISTSLKGSGENIFAYPPQIMPSDFTFANYVGVWKKVDFMAYFVNSMIVASLWRRGRLAFLQGRLSLNFGRYCAAC